MPENSKKNPFVEKEEEVLKFWQERLIFEKSLNKPSPRGDFIFYEGPPTANGKPGIHHFEPRAFKDAIPRYKTMQGFNVRRKGGWDTHGLPVELAVEKELGLKSKKEIETYGIEAFNKKCRESVWKYVKEWEQFTDRMGYWVDLKRPYVTYKPYYIESVWNIVSKINERKLLYKDYKVVPWCPRCGTALSSHELAQGYEDVKDLSVYVKFKVKSEKFKSKDGSGTYVLAWTTTPWTLPGNVALAVNSDIDYVSINVSNSGSVETTEVYGDRERKKSIVEQGTHIFAKDCIPRLLKIESFIQLFIVSDNSRDYNDFVLGKINQEQFISKLKTVKGKELVGLEYEPLYQFLKDNLSESEKPKLKNAFKIYPADFVTTTDGTGIVHTAVMYGTDDFELGTKVGLPKHHLVKEDGTFKEEAGFLAGKFVKPARTEASASNGSGGDEATDILIIKDLARRGLLFAKEKYTHSYPHCWRCKTPLIYFARDSWYIKMSSLKSELIAENQKINWEPSYIKDGRFGEWLKDVKDWAISRERYWGTPLPVWECTSCDRREVAGSFEQLFLRSKNKKLTRLVLVRHGESEKNILGIFDSSRDKYPLTRTGEKEAKTAAKKIKGMEVSAIYSSPVLRAHQTAEIIGKAFGKDPVLSDELWEARSGEWDGKEDSVREAEADRVAYNKLPHDIYYKTPRGKTGESWQQVEDRVSGFARKILASHVGETVVIVSHEGPLMTLLRYLKELSLDEITNLWEERRNFHRGLLGGYAEPSDVYIDSLTGKEFDPHRPFIDEIAFDCECGKEMKRVKEVMDVWFDSGAMPYAEEHYPFKNKEWIDGGGYPADFISEAIDQTRGWFYTLHAIGTLLGKGRAYKNVISLGHILDSEGRKMSKSLGNTIDPNVLIEKYGADPLLFWMYSVNQPGEPKNFDEKTVDEIVKKVFNLASNVLAFYQLYAGGNKLSTFPASRDFAKRGDFQLSTNVLDQWIIARLNQLINEVTASLDSYKLLEPTRAIRDFIADLSQWYLRRSRERIKNGGEEGNAALATLRFVLCELSKIMAPFTPFFAEYLYKTVGGEKESVHLETWPGISLKSKVESSKVLEEMTEVRRVVSLALEARAKANVKVRQPLQKLKIRNEKSKVSDERILELIRDEVNVKEVLFDKAIENEVELDIIITPELKEEGDVRELIRAIQDLRKETGLNPGDLASLLADADEKGKIFVGKYETELMKATQLNKISFVSLAEGGVVTLDNFSLKILIEK
ncbi:MAG: class I tRNA ligase family protein [bacterium]|nr:class I tRNA ligase family protein [bacterium]